MLTTLISEGRALLEAAASVKVKAFIDPHLARAVADSLLDDPAARATGVTFAYWDEALTPSDRKFLNSKWPALKAAIRKHLPGYLLSTLFPAVHNQIDSDWNDGEPYPYGDAKSVWPSDVRDWWLTLEPKLKSATFDISDIIDSPKTGLSGFKVTMTPAPSKLPRYNGKHIKPVL